MVNSDTESAESSIQSLGYIVGTTAKGNLKLSRPGDPGALRLVTPLGEKLLSELGFKVGDSIADATIAHIEKQGGLNPPPGALSGRSMELPWEIQRALKRREDPLQLTSRNDANRLGWRSDSVRGGRQSRPKNRQLWFSESRGELYFFVSSLTDGYQTYHLLQSAIPILMEKAVMVGDRIGHDLQFDLLLNGHLYTDHSGRTGY